MWNKKNILIVIPSLTLWWWAEKVAVNVGDYLGDFHNISYYTFYSDVKKYPHVWKYYSCHQKNISSMLKIIRIPINIFKLYRFCKKHKTDVIISHMEQANIISIVVSLLLRNLRQISVVHNSAYSLQFFNKILINLLYKYSYRVICVSKWIQSMLVEKFWMKNTQLLYNSLDIQKVRELWEWDILTQDMPLFKKDVYTYISVWKLRDSKLQERLIEAFDHSYKEDKNIQLIIIWEWPYREDLERKIREKSLENHIHLIWLRENIFPYLKKSDCFVFSSSWEGFWIVLIEALVYKMPIISTDCFYGPREILAPDREISEILNYPYIWDFGILESNDSFDSKSFARSMLNIKQGKHTFGEENFQRFDRNYILPKWQEIIW